MAHDVLRMRSASVSMRSGDTRSWRSSPAAMSCRAISSNSLAVCPAWQCSCEDDSSRTDGRYVCMYGDDCGVVVGPAIARRDDGAAAPDQRPASACSGAGFGLACGEPAWNGGGVIDAVYGSRRDCTRRTGQGARARVHRGTRQTGVERRDPGDMMDPAVAVDDDGVDGAAAARPATNGSGATADRRELPPSICTTPTIRCMATTAVPTRRSRSGPMRTHCSRTSAATRSDSRTAVGAGYADPVPVRANASVSPMRPSRRRTMPGDDNDDASIACAGRAWRTPRRR